VTREVHVVASVDVLGADGSVETITGTTIHPVWSVDRQEWVPLAARQARHASRFQIQPIIHGLTRADARAIEQRLIDTIGLVKNGGTLLNKINSIAESNSIYASAIQRAIALGF